MPKTKESVIALGLFFTARSKARKLVLDFDAVSELPEAVTSIQQTLQHMAGRARVIADYLDRLSAEGVSTVADLSFPSPEEDSVQPRTPSATEPMLPGHVMPRQASDGFAE